MRLPFREPRGASAGFASHIPLNRKYAAESMRDKVQPAVRPLYKFKSRRKTRSPPPCVSAGGGPDRIGGSSYTNLERG